MSSEGKAKLHLEIAHVLFMDVVGYSKLLVDDQAETLALLNQIVRGTGEFRAAEEKGELIRLPTGDGMALVFLSNPEDPVQCALEISKAIKAYPQLQLRMGIHSGPVNKVTDVNDRANVTGAGINLAQRVMDCGDAGHILLSKRAADDLAQYRHWQPCLHDVGEFEVKHGTLVHVFNLYTDEAGNPQTPQKLAGQKRRRRAGAAVTQAYSPTWRKPALIAGSLVLLVGLAAGLWLASHRVAPKSADSAITVPTAPAPSASPKAAIPEKSIAVLPFDNLSSDKENAYFAEGIQDEILTRLSKIADLKVISRTSTQHYKSAPENLSEIGKQLGVAHVVEGSVQKSGDAVRVNVQLIKAANDSHLWADTYDRKLTDIFQVESEIAKAIAETLQAKLTGSEQHALASRPTENAEAHQFYLKGRYYWNRRSEEGLKKAIDYFSQAIAADPNYALAYTGVADSYVLLGFHGYGALPPMEAYPKAKVAAEKALQIDETLGEAHASLGQVKENYDWDLVGADKEYKRALELSPKYATAHQWYASHLAVIGKYPEAIAQIKQAQELDPLSLIINVNISWFFYFARQYDDALAQCRKTLDLDPNFAATHWMLGQAYRQKGLHEEAIAEFQKQIVLRGDPVGTAVLGHAYAVAGKRAEAEKILKELMDLSKERYFPPYFIALIYVGLNDKDQAFAWLEKAFVERSAGMVVLKVEPMFDPIRSDPRFQDLLHRVGLPP